MIAVNTKFLDGTRFLLSLWVLLGHFYLYTGAAEFINLSYFGAILGRPSIAVDGFMLITGFLMAYNHILRSEKEPPLHSSTRQKFWMRRFFRLYPVYLLFVIIGYFFNPYIIANLANMKGYFSGNYDVSAFDIAIHQAGLSELFSHLLLIQGLIPSHTSSINGVTWSLSLEMQFYALFPFIFIWLFGNASKLKNRLIVSFFLSIIMAFVSTRIGLSLGFHYPSVLINKLPIFLLGMILAFTVTKQIHGRYLGMSLILLATILDIFQISLFIFIVLFINLNNIQEFLPNSINNKLYKINSLLSNKASQFGANISYTLYLSHPIIMVLITNFIISLEFNKYFAAVISLVLIIITNFCVAHLIYKYYEDPFNSLGKRIVANGMLKRYTRKIFS